MYRPRAEVSIILPTYNRADTVMRAIDSIIGQTFEDWELIIVDDGSTDNTAQLTFDFDPRIHLIRQRNQGVAAARNAGIAASTGRLIAFLDSDDEWLPHFLSLSVAFFNEFPDDQYLTFEFFQDDTDHRMIKGTIVNCYQSIARMIGSDAFELPDGQTDDYLRVFRTKSALGTWARRCSADMEASEAFLYQGHIFRYTRWGYFAWLPATVMTRQALELVGRFDASKRSAEDYPFQALLARHFRTNFISLPSARKHEHGLHSDPLKEDHLATGPNAYAFRVNRLQYFDQLHWNQNRSDPELSLLRKHYIYETACLALRSGFRNKSIALFKEAACFRNRLWHAYFLAALAVCCPSDKTASAAYGTLRLVLRVLRQFPWETA